MATTYNVRYKNHCTPQAQVISGGRYYLDSDCGRKLTGDCSTVASLTTTGTYDESFAVTDSASSALTSSHEFLFIKNTGSVDVLLALNGDNDYHILLSEGEAFASEIDTSSVVMVKTGSGTSTVEYFASV